MRQITDSAELVGKVIKEIKGDTYDSHWYDFAHLILIFNDNTFVGLLGGRRYDDEHYVEIADSPPQSTDLMNLGFITQEEHLKRNDEELEKNKVKHEAWERKKWEELNMKYGPVAPSGEDDG